MQHYPPAGYHFLPYNYFPPPPQGSPFQPAEAPQPSSNVQGNISSLQPHAGNILNVGSDQSAVAASIGVAPSGVVHDHVH